MTTLDAPDDIMAELAANVPPAVDAEHRRWACLIAYAESRSELYASRVSGLHITKVRSILAEPEAAADLAACRDGIRMGLANGYLQIQLLAQQRCMDRLQNGDVIATKMGLMTVPVRARDAATIFKLAGERHDILTGNIAPAAAADTRLIELAATLMDVALSHTAPKGLPSPADEQSVSIQQVMGTEGDPEGLDDDAQLDAALQQSIQ